MIQQKPHGHGDVHALLHSTGLVKRWKQSGVQWVCFFQDTNGLVFRALPAALGEQASMLHQQNQDAAMADVDVALPECLYLCWLLTV